jgi:hypothetical protein
MRKIRLTGREAKVIRTIGFALALPGAEIMEITKLEAEDLTDVLNGLMTVGFVECIPYADQISMEAMPTTEFEVNSAYSHELKTSLGMSGGRERRR